MRKLLAPVLFVAAVTACGPRDLKPAIGVEGVSLGRVVVYRNGVAFYERRAHITGGKLTVTVPRERVDDFLKSLTVVDARTDTPMPVSFPRHQADYGAEFIEMTLELPTKEPADVVLTYVTESPAWKPSYRVVVGEDADGKKTGTVMLEGWAVVDNTSGEDWKKVTVGVGSSSALSFRYDLWSVRNVQRETLAAEERFAIAPPTGVSPYGGIGGTAQAQLGALAELTDDEIRRPPGHPEDQRAERLALQSASEREEADSIDVSGDWGGGDGAMSAGGGGGGGGGKIKTSGHRRRVAKADKPRDARPRPPARPAATPPPVQRYAQGDSKLRSIVAGARRSGNTIVIEGVADANRAGAEGRALDRANIVKNQLIDSGLAPGQVRVVTRVAANEPDRVRLGQEATRTPATTTDATKGQAAMVEEGPVGESHFESKTPMTVGRGTSAMVSMVKRETPGEIVYLFDAESERGNDKYAFKAVKLINPTDSTLETGPVTVYGSKRFIGEGLSEPIPPGAVAVVPFALDRQVIVDKDQNDDNQISRLVTLQRGILTAEVQHIKRTKLTLTNRSTVHAVVFIRHTVDKGWILKEHPVQFTRVGDAHLFEIGLPAGESQTVTLAEATPLTRTLDLNSDVALKMMKIYVESPEPTGALREQLKGLLAIHREIIDGAEKIDSLRRRLVDYRQRMDELHAQLLTLQAVKTGGELMKHLKDKMKDISNRVQHATIDVVDTEEKLMLGRVRFQDALAELKLGDVLEPVATK